MNENITKQADHETKAQLPKLKWALANKSQGVAKYLIQQVRGDAKA